MTDTNPELMERANHLLRFLVDRADRDWRKVMDSALTDSEYELNIGNMMEQLEELGLEEPFGAIEGGTGIMKEEAGLEGEEGQQAVQILKQENRLQQCGRGRGKCLIVLTDAPLGEEETAKPEAIAVTAKADHKQEVETTEPTDTDMIEATNVPGLLRAARDEYRNVSRRLSEATRTLRVTEKENEELKEQLQQQQSTIRELEEKLEQNAVASWQ